MSDRISHFTLRQLRAHFSQSHVLLSLAGVGIVLGIAGPFGTNDVMRLIPRLAYWVPVTFLTYTIGFFAAIWAEHRFARTHAAIRLGAKCAVTSLGVLAFILIANFAVFAIWPEPTALAITAASTIAIATVITVVIDSLARPSGPAGLDALPPILDRLPFDQRAPLVALTVEDHYVRVMTTKGEAMILMRLADAIKEAAPTQGLQTHRSHWVALPQIKVARRDGDRALLHMSNDAQIPVSRANLPAIKAAGLLP